MEEDDLDVSELVARSQRQFVADFPNEFARLGALVDAASGGDGGALTDLRQAAHRLIGRAGILQFLPLARHASALETVARVDDVRHFDRGAATACLAAMRDAFTDVRVAAPAAPAASPARALVLVADDDEDQRFLLTRLLHRAGFDVVAAATGPELVALARTRSPAAILLDVQMPGQDGFETGRQLQADPRTALIPVMYLTGLSDPGDRAVGLAAGADDYASKSIDPVELIERLRKLCARLSSSSER